MEAQEGGEKEGEGAGAVVDGGHLPSGGERGGEGGGRSGGGGASSLAPLRGRLEGGCALEGGWARGESGALSSSHLMAAALSRALTLLRWFWNQICTERSFMPSSTARRARAGPSGVGALAKAAQRPSSCEGQILVRRWWPRTRGSLVEEEREAEREAERGSRLLDGAAAA